MHSCVWHDYYVWHDAACMSCDACQNMTTRLSWLMHMYSATVTHPWVYHDSFKKNHAPWWSQLWRVMTSWSMRAGSMVGTHLENSPVQNWALWQKRPTKTSLVAKEWWHFWKRAPSKRGLLKKSPETRDKRSVAKPSVETKCSHPTCIRVRVMSVATEFKLIWCDMTSFTHWQLWKLARESYPTLGTRLQYVSHCLLLEHIFTNVPEL